MDDAEDLAQRKAAQDALMQDLGGWLRQQRLRKHEAGDVAAVLLWAAACLVVGTGMDAGEAIRTLNQALDQAMSEMDQMVARGWSSWPRGKVSST